MGNNFDERYPAIFQSGGDNQAVEQLPRHELTPALAHEPAPTGTAAPAGNPALPVSVAAPERAWRWYIAVIAGALVLASGLFCLFATYWIPSSLVADPADFNGLNVQPWGNIISQAAPALIGGGLGLLAVLFFLTTRRRAAAESMLRVAFGVFGLCVGVAGWVALFSPYMFPEAAAQGIPVGSGDLNRIPLTFVLMPCGTWLIALALLMLAALFVLPRRWPRIWREDTAGELRESVTGEASSPSARRGLVVGVVVVAAGIFAMFCPYLFPMSTGSTTVTAEGGGMYSQHDWASVAGYLTTPLMFAGLMVLGWACLHLTFTVRRSGGIGAALLGGDATEA